MVITFFLTVIAAITGILIFFLSIAKLAHHQTNQYAYRIFSIKRPPSKKRPPPLFFLVLHFSKVIWTEILGRVMKKYNTMSHIQRFSNRYMQ